MPNMIEIRDVSKVYRRGKQQVEVLHHVDLEVASGEFLALMGPSGSGKTTLLNLIGGLDAPTSGSITVGGERIDQLGAGALARWRAAYVGFIFQFYNLMPALSAQKNVELPLLLTKLSGAQRKKNAAIALQLVGLADRASHKPNELSGGQQQRVAVARALASKPQIIFADEPTGNLDSRAGTEILDFMRRAVREMGQTIVMVTHDPVAAAYAQRVLFLGDGRIVDEMADPTAERVLDRMKQFGE